MGHHFKGREGLMQKASGRGRLSAILNPLARSRAVAVQKMFEAAQEDKFLVWDRGRSSSYPMDTF